jgi:hypothetical protein
MSGGPSVGGGVSAPPSDCPPLIDAQARTMFKLDVRSLKIEIEKRRPFLARYLASPNASDGDGVWEAFAGRPSPLGIIGRVDPSKASQFVKLRGQEREPALAKARELFDFYDAVAREWEACASMP